MIRIEIILTGAFDSEHTSYKKGKERRGNGKEKKERKKKEEEKLFKKESKVKRKLFANGIPNSKKVPT
jgi:hypothetical protein